MFTRSELEIKTVGELKGLSKQYGLKPLGNSSYKTAWIDGLLTFAAIVLRQMKQPVSSLVGCRTPAANTTAILGGENPHPNKPDPTYISSFWDFWFSFVNNLLSEVSVKLCIRFYNNCNFNV